MATTNEDIGFDLDLLLPCQTVDSTSASKLEYLRKSIRVAKKRTLVSNALVTQVLALRKELDAAQNSLIASNKERDEWYTSYNHGCASNKNLEVEIQKLQVKNKELEEKCFNTTNQCDAVKSHANQLQLLVNENETQLEALNIENRLEKSCLKELEKTITSLKKKNENLSQELSAAKEVLYGKNKLRKNHKKILQKYKKLNLLSDSDDEFISGEEDIENDVNIFDGLPIYDKNMTDNNYKKAQNSSTVTYKNKTNKNNVDRILEDAKVKHSDNGHDSDCANEVISVDTGRGSSLAFSDSDKCFHSPDYVMGSSPLNIDTMDSKKDKRNVIDIATSPIPKNRTTHIATSPIIFENESSNLHMVKVVQLVDRDTSPIRITKHVSTSTSPIEKLSKGVTSSSKKRNNKTSGNVHEINHERGSIIREKECLELNNSNNLCDDKIIDCEIETILSTMRINHTLLTPIPLTPSKSRDINMTQETNELKTQAGHSRGYVCKEAAQVKEDNKIMKASLDVLINEVMSIKSLLKNQLINNIHSVSNQQIIDDNNTNKNNADNLRKCDRTSSKRLRDTNPVIKETIHKKVAVPPYLKGKCAGLETSLCDSKDAKQTEELSTNDIDVSDDEILQEHMEIESSTNITQRLEFIDSVSSNSIITVPTDELSTRHTVVCDDENLQESMGIESSTNVTQRLEFIDSVSSNSMITVPTDELSTRHIVVCDDEILQESMGIESSTNVTQRIEFNDSLSPNSTITVPTEKVTSNRIVVNDIETLHESITNISSSNTSDIIQHNDSVTSDSMTTIAINQLFSTNVNRGETLQEPIGNEFSPDITHTFQFESSISSDEFEEDTNAINDNVSDTETTNLITLNNDEKKSDYESPHEYCLNKIMKKKKLTTLDKLRKKMLPKSKISCGVKPLKKIFTKPKPLPIYKKEVKDSDSAASLNDRSVYEKAIKVMAELNSKQKEISNDSADSYLDSTQNICTKVTKASPKKSNFIYHYDKKSNELPVSPTSAIITRSRSKNDQKGTCSVVRNLKLAFDETSSPHSLSKDESDIKEMRKGRKRVSIDKSEIHCKRMLRSSKVNQHSILETETELEKLVGEHSSHTCDRNVNSDKNLKNISNESNVLKNNVGSCSDLQILSDKNDFGIGNNIACKSKINELRVVVEKYNYTCLPKNLKKVSDQSLVQQTDARSERVVSYSDLQMFSDKNYLPKEKGCSDQNTVFGNCDKSPKNSILCVMVQRYGTLSVKNGTKKLPETATNTICKMIEDKIANIIEVPATEIKDAMNDFVAEIHSLDINLFIMGLMKYLKDPGRRTELYNTVYSPPAPCMTKSEQVLLYVVAQLKSSSTSADIVVKILDNIEYTLFKLNQTPEFAIVESMSHFYAVICRYFKAKSRLRLFILDAMYCIQFKAVVLIKQCLDVWMHILPLAHMGVAKSPLVTCLVYLLHYYKCEDKFNRVQDIRQILSRKYFYEITEWNETKILDMFKCAIMELKDISVEKKMLRMALIIIAKRHGPKWCQNNIIKNLLLPMIDMPNVKNSVKNFCISMIGPLLKPYPVDMKVHCEVIMNQLLNMLQQNSSCAMQEAILVSLIFMSKHNPYRVNQALLSWEAKRVSYELESVLRDYVKEKPVKTWKIIVSKIAHSNLNK